MRTDPATTPELPTACPSCGAAVRSSVSWCSLCFAPLTVADVVEDATDSPADASRGGPVPSLLPSAPAVGADADRAHLDAVASRLLAELAAQQGPRPGSRLPPGRAARAGLMADGGVGACALLVGLLALLGLFL